MNWSELRLAGVVFLAAAGCTPQSEPLPGPPPEPPLGRWQFEQITGAITSRSGGSTPVICTRGHTERQPMPLFADPKPPTWLELEGDGRLHFVLAFEGESRAPGEEASSVQLLGNIDRAQLRALEEQSSWVMFWPQDPTTTGSWRYVPPGPAGKTEDERPADVNGSLAVTGLEDSAIGQRAQLILEGRFTAFDQLEGTWNYKSERREAGGCWAAASGEGTWLARPAPDRAATTN